METKKCKECGRELPITEFMMTRWGTYSSTCKKCSREKYAETFYKNCIGGVSRMQFIDPDYERNTLELECK